MSQAGLARYRIGVDVGGTFTDFVMADLHRGGLIFHKEASVPADPSAAVATGIAALLARTGADAADIGLIAHGTTLALNAIIEQRGTRVALVVSRGNRDVMELARGRLPNSYNFRIGRERSLVPREDVFEIGARLRADGTEDAPLDLAELDAIAATIEQRGFRAVAVMLLNAYRDGALEARVAQHLRARLPGVLVSASAALWPELREYERALIAVLNAYVHPLMAAYLDGLTARLAVLGVSAPVTIASNAGGTIALAAARARPIDTVLSGPASGVRAAARLAQGMPALLTFDMGGTSTDVSMIEDGALEFARTSMVGDYPLMLPVVAVSAIGAGGGSRIWLDNQGVLKVGPDSAGADPGPIAYGRGGTVPTVTDALLVLGVLHPDRFLGGRMRLDRPAAEAALTAIGTRLALRDARDAAAAAIRVATARMGTELTKVLAQRGADPREQVLLAYGGAGPTMASLVAEEAGLNAVMVPPSPGTFCALGAVIADLRQDFVRPARVPIGDGGGGHARVRALLAELLAEAAAWIAAEGGLVSGHTMQASCDMRYPGQAFELAIPLGTAEAPEQDAVAAFHAAHERIYGFREAGSAIEVMTVRLAVTGHLAPVTLPIAAARAAPQATERRSIRLDVEHEAAVFPRDEIGPGATLAGPAIIEQADTTTLILPGWTASGDDHGALHLRRAP